MSKVIYMDYNATAPILSDVINIMHNLRAPLNPSSVHSFGRNASNILETEREKIAHLLNIDKNNHDIIFVSCGTEANNTVINSFLSQNAKIFISATEHLSMYAYHNQYNKVATIKVKQDGVVDLEYLESILKTAMTEKTLVSVMYANNETGVINPLKEISCIARKYNAYVHSDCVQVIGKIDFNFKDLDIDFATISSHKIGGPCGIGLLIAKKGLINPMIIGGGQERGFRSGTENIMGIVGFSKALELSITNTNKYQSKVTKLRNLLESKIENYGVVVGKATDRICNTSMIIMPNVEAQTQLIIFDINGIAISNGSACSSGKIKESHVLKAMGYEEHLINNGIRISLGIDNEYSDIEKFVDIWMTIYSEHAKHIKTYN